MYKVFDPPLQEGDKGYVCGWGPYCLSKVNRFPGYECTLPEGHLGQHAAHGSKGEIYAKWHTKDNVKNGKEFKLNVSQA